MQGHRAGVVSRFLADAIYLGVILLSLVAVYAAVATTRFLLEPRRFTWPEPSGMHLVALGWLLLLAYLAIGWSNTGRTIGKRILGLRVVDASGGTLRLGRCLLRAWICVALPFGLFWCVLSKLNASIADLIVRSSVVYAWGPKLPAARD